MLKRIFLLILFLVITATMLSVSRISVEEKVVFDSTPLWSLRWELSDHDFHLGDLIEATVVITTQPGTMLNFEKLGSPGQTMTLPSRPDPRYALTADSEVYGYISQPVILEGELEILDRKIYSYVEDGQVITRISYQLIYLQPLDLTEPTDGKILPQYLPFTHTFWRLASDGNIKLGTLTGMTPAEVFSLTPQASLNSNPIFSPFVIIPPATYWPAMKTTGAGLILLAFGLAFWGFSRRRHLVDQTEAYKSKPDIKEYYRRWQETKDDQVFFETLVEYRNGAWGRPRIASWINTNRILYSRNRLTQEEKERELAHIIKEVSL